MRKIIITVAPVCHVGKEIPEGVHNPLSPEEIAEDTIRCYEAGACEVHLHTRDLKGEQTFELDVFSDTIRRIREKTDMIIQGSTGGLSSLTLAERCVCLNVPEVEVASLNMGSVNFGETVYINTLPDIRYWAARMKETGVVPEMELFDLSMVETCSKLADEGVLSRPLHYNFCVGRGTSSNLSATGRNLCLLNALCEQGSSWGITHDQMDDFSMLACAIQFALGHRLGQHEEDTISATQACGQKNTVFIIWVGYTFLSPITSLAGGFYSIWPNVCNSYQLYRQAKATAGNHR